MNLTTSPGAIADGRELPAGNCCSPGAAGTLKRLLRIAALVLLGVAAYFWNSVAILALVRFDRTGLEPGEPAGGGAVDVSLTLASCISPVGWIVAAGIFALALGMAWQVRRWPAPLRALVAAAPVALVIRQIMVADIHPWVRPTCLVIATAQLLLAASAALLCRAITNQKRTNSNARISSAINPITAHAVADSGASDAER